MSKAKNIGEETLIDLINSFSLFENEEIAELSFIEDNYEHVLSGWLGLYDCIATLKSGKEFEINVRYAYGDEILYQDLIDFMYTSSVLTGHTIGSRDRYIIYICDFTPEERLKGVVMPVPVRFLPHNSRKVSRFLVAHEDIKDLIEISPDELEGTRGFSTESIKINDDSNPLISVIIPSFNSAATIEQAIQSAINQTYKNIELIIIDGGSTDNTHEIIEKYKRFISVYVNEKDKGIFDAINKGTFISQGQYSVFIGADDLIFCDTIKIVAEAIMEQSFPDYLYGDLNVLRLNGDISQKKSFIRSKRYGQFNMFHPSLFISKKVFAEFGGFDIRYKGTSDADFELKLITNNKRGIKIDHFCSLFREGGLTFLYEGKYSEAWEIFRKNRALSLKFVVNYLKFRTYKYAVKYFRYKGSHK